MMVINLSRFKKIIGDRDAPICLTAQAGSELTVPAHRNRAFGAWIKVALEGLTERDRILWFLVIFEFLFIITLFGAGQPMNIMQAESMASSVASGLPYSSGREAVALSIFYNNYFLAILMDIPLAGPVMAAYMSFNSGVYVSAQAIASSSMAQVPATGIQEMIFYLSLPTFWLEYVAYALATLESIYVIAALFTRKFLSELPKFILVIASVTLILFVSAQLEAFFYMRHGQEGSEGRDQMNYE